MALTAINQIHPKSCKSKALQLLPPHNPTEQQQVLVHHRYPFQGHFRSCLITRINSSHHSPYQDDSGGLNFQIII